MAAPTESKVWAATIGSGAGLAISEFILWILGVTIWGASNAAGKAADAVAAVPQPVAGIIGLGLTAGLAFAAGWLAKHTHVTDNPTAGMADVTVDHGIIPGDPIPDGPPTDEPVSDGTIDPSLLVDPAAAPAAPADSGVPFIPPAVA